MSVDAEWNPYLPTLRGAIIGEDALQYHPRPGRPRVETDIAAGGVEEVDAWGGVAARLLVEYYARWHQRPVRCWQPGNEGAWNVLFSMLSYDPPRHFEF